MRSPTLIQLLLPLAATACASAGQQSAAPESPSYQEVGVYTVGLRPSEAAEHSIIHAPPSEVYAALRAVYTQTLHVPLAQDDSAAGQIASRQARATRTIGDKPMSTYFDCGLGQIGPRADHSSILLRLISQVQPFGKDSAGIATTVVARSEDPGTSTDPISCESTGRLEKFVATMTSLRLLH